MGFDGKTYSWCDEIKVARMLSTSHIVEENRELC